MSFVMLADQRKYARGYIIRSSLLNETIVTLHACGREGCSGFPMWANPNPYPYPIPTPTPNPTPNPHL